MGVVAPGKKNKREGYTVTVRRTESRTSTVKPRTFSIHFFCINLTFEGIREINVSYL